MLWFVLEDAPFSKATLALILSVLPVRFAYQPGFRPLKY